MNKKWSSLVLAAGLLLSSVQSITVYADGQKVVTLGADLSEEQQTAILKYFGIYGNSSVETIMITNQDERDHLASYVPIEQIGTRTYSCALVNPTSSGGIQVRTANLNWVTGNMIASTLSTAGVVNCEVLAASPFEVSGTGALTGVIMAYEQASGTTLDEEKKELATQELVTTGTIADEIGQDAATSLVNEVKIQIIEGQVIDKEEVEEIVEEVLDDNTVTLSLSDEDRQLLNDLANQIAQQQYNYEDVKETLQRVEENTSQDNSSDEQTSSNTDQNTDEIQIITIEDYSSTDDNIDSNVNTNENSTANDNANTNENTNNNTTVINIINSSENHNSTSSEDSILNNTDITALEDLSGSAVITTTTDETTDETEAVDGEWNASDAVVETETENQEETGLEITISDSYTEDVNTSDNSGISAVEETTAAEETPIVEETQAAEETPIVEETQAAEETPIVEETQAAEETPIVEETQAAEETPIVEETQAAEETPIVEETQTAEETPAAEEIQEEVQIAEEAPTVEEQTVTEAAEAEEETEIPETEAIESEVLTFQEEPVIVLNSMNDGNLTGSSYLRMYFPLDNIRPVSGILNVIDEQGNTICSADLGEDHSILIQDMTTTELEQQGWTSENGGTSFMIVLDQNLDTYTRYTISFDGVLAQSETSDIPETAPAAQIIMEKTVETIGYGTMLYIENLQNLSAGSTITGSFLLTDEWISSAQLISWDPELVSVEETDGGFSINLIAPGRTELVTAFYDSDGNEVDYQTQELTILE